MSIISIFLSSIVFGFSQNGAFPMLIDGFFNAVCTLFLNKDFNKSFKRYCHYPRAICFRILYVLSFGQTFDIEKDNSLLTSVLKTDVKSFVPKISITNSSLFFSK